MSKYTITMDLQVLNHLGVNLYSSMPAVISEVVANAWDADATEVRISASNDKIVVFDNGCGMDADDINGRFLRVGYRKRTDLPVTMQYNRPVMGRKGIGKLSLFSIANTIDIESVKNGQKNALRIDTNELDNAIKNNNNYNPIELDIGNIEFENDGTKITLTDLKKRSTQFNRFLKRRLARRFSVIGEQNNFRVFVNDVEIKIEDREYLSKAQYLWVYGDEEYYKSIIAQTKPEILKNCVHTTPTIEYENEKHEIRGWLATSEEPNVLKDEDESVNRIAIMVRGKMAKEDILSELNETGLYAKYVFGEISADFLDLDNVEDITTSNRQDFFEDDERYLQLKTLVKKEITKIKNSWIELRNARGTEEAVKIEVVKEWYDELGRDDQRTAGRLFGKINQLTIPAPEKRELVRHSILAFETLKLKTCLNEFDDIATEDISAFIKAAEVLNSIEATYYYKIVYERLSVIRKMKKVTDEGALEKVIQELLAQHLWLLDPSWDRGTEMPAVEEAVKTQFNVVNSKLTAEEKDGRFDIRYKKAANKHIVIELKKAEKTIKSLALLEQMRKYHSAMCKILEERRDDEPFEMIVLVGKELDGRDVHPKTYQKTLSMFEEYDTRIMTYKELIYNAEKMYSDFIEKNKEADKMFDRFIKTPELQQ